MKLEGKLEELRLSTRKTVEKIVNESPAVRIAEFGVKRAELRWRGKNGNHSRPATPRRMEQNGELLSGLAAEPSAAGLCRRLECEFHSSI